MAALRTHDVGVENSITVVADASVRAPHVLLPNLVNLGLDGNRSLIEHRC